MILIALVFQEILRTASPTYDVTELAVGVHTIQHGPVDLRQAGIRLQSDSLLYVLFAQRKRIEVNVVLSVKSFSLHQMPSCERQQLGIRSLIEFAANGLSIRSVRIGQVNAPDRSALQWALRSNKHLM